MTKVVTTSSQSKTSEAQQGQAPPEETEEQRKAREESEQAAANQEKDHEKRKGNLAKVEDPETYNPYADPDVPSSQLADVIRDELAGGKHESPTLKALREEKKEEEKKDSDE